jgi:DNA-binding CsgD family transcriptional regulator
MSVLDIFTGNGNKEHIIVKIMQGGFKNWRETIFNHLKKDGQLFPVEISLGTFLSQGRNKAIMVVRDISKKIKLEADLAKADIEIQKVREALDNKNIALREMLLQVEAEKMKIQQSVLSNIDELLMPMIRKFEAGHVSARNIDLFKKNLEKLTSSFGRNISDRKSNLTLKEIAISNMIRNGMSSKEIADESSLSLLTIEKHRKNIRQKLGISNKDINLASFLKNLE